VELARLTPHPSNPRQGDLRAISASIERHGFYGAIVANKTTSHILAGNHRYLAARSLGFASVPVVWVEVEKEEELRILAADNRTSELGTFDLALLDDLLETLGDDLTGTGYELPDFSDLFDEPEQEQEHEPDDLIDDLTDDTHAPNVIWPSDNVYGVPQLLDTMQATICEAPILVWGDQARSKYAGTYLFFTDDYKFEALWSDPSTLVNSGAPVAAEPNYSTALDTPPAMALWGIYRKRWINRWWQSRGVKTLVDLNIDQSLWRWSLLGVPKTWRAWITRLHAGDDAMQWLEMCWSLVTDHTGTQDGHLFVVYGGGRDIRQHCIDRGWWWVPERKQVFDGKWKQSDYVTNETHTHAQEVDHG
jgi:hypothetical protein